MSKDESRGTASASPVLHLDAVSVQFDDGRLALHRVSLQLEGGERVALLGANGSGKTTCLYVMAGVRRPTSGVVRLRGEPADGTLAQRQRWRREIGMVLADIDDQLIAPIVRDDVAFGLRNAARGDGTRNEAHIQSQVMAVLEDLGIAALADRAVHTLSLGERRRVALAGVLIVQPALLLLDEPTANLDRRARQALRALLDGAHAAQRTVCLATHDSGFAQSWATRVVLLEDGVVIANGDPADVLSDASLLDRAGLDRPCVT